MNIIDTEFKGLHVIENQRIVDNRGWFEKKYNIEKLGKINNSVGESYISLSSRSVLRGLHFQTGNFAQSKLVTCISGSFLDIAVDLRKEEPTFGRVFLRELDSRRPISLFIPGEFAHGIYAFEDQTILLNYAGSIYSPGNEGGINWRSISELAYLDCPIVSEKDDQLPPLDDVLNSL